MFKREAFELIGASWLVKAYPDMPVICQRDSIEHMTDEL